MKKALFAFLILFVSYACEKEDKEPEYMPALIDAPITPHIYGEDIEWTTTYQNLIDYSKRSGYDDEITIFQQYISVLIPRTDLWTFYFDNNRCMRITMERYNGGLYDGPGLLRRYSAGAKEIIEKYGEKYPTSYAVYYIYTDTFCKLNMKLRDGEYWVAYVDYYPNTPNNREKMQIGH